MKKLLLTNLFLFLSLGGIYAQFGPVLEWNAKLGGTGASSLNKTAVDADGNLYAVGDYTGTIDCDLSETTSFLINDGDRDVFSFKYYVSNLASGVYILKLSGDNLNHSSKFIKQ